MSEGKNGTVVPVLKHNTMNRYGGVKVKALTYF
jgi:hypothetical protein